MKRWLNFWAMILALASPGLAANAPQAGSEIGQLPAIPPAPHGHKFLFIVDVSRSMKQFSSGGAATLHALIQSGLLGHMHAGDTYGVWAYRSELMAGDYPMQVWHPAHAVSLAHSASNFIHRLGLEGRSQWDTVTQALDNVVRTIQDGTIFVVSDDKNEITGLAFSEPINAIYERRKGELKKHELPFVTWLRISKGLFVTADVVLAGEYLDLGRRPPPLPWPPPPLSETKAGSQHAAERSASNLPPRPTGQSIIMTKETVQREKEAMQATLKTSFGASADTAVTPPQPKLSGTNAPKDAGTAPVIQTQSESESPQARARKTLPPENPDLVPSNPAVDGPLHALNKLSNPQEQSTISEQASGPSRWLGDPITVSAREPDLSAPPGMTALATPRSPSSGSGRWWFAFGAFTVALASGLACLALLRRRPRSSFITQSMNR